MRTMNVSLTPEMADFVEKELATGDYATASALSAGMKQALLSTAGSLMLAIPAHLAHHFLSGRVRAIVRDVEWSGNEIMKYLLTDYRSGGPAVSVDLAQGQEKK